MFERGAFSAPDRCRRRNPYQQQAIHKKRFYGQGCPAVLTLLRGALKARTPHSCAPAVALHHAEKGYARAFCIATYTG